MLEALDRSAIKRPTGPVVGDTALTWADAFAPVERNPLLTDPIADLRAALRAKPALIVHFSGVPKGIGHSRRYPQDLELVLANPNEILCCSTIEPGDLDRRPPGATGSVGVVLDPIDEASVVFVHYDDVGSPPSTDERRSTDRQTSVADCVRSFTRDGLFPYNEWLVGPYRVVGLFVGSEAQVQMPDGLYRDVSPADVLNDLGPHRLFSCQDGQFVELDQGYWRPLVMTSIYP